MATVVAPYTLVDGSTLDADQYNDNIYDPSVAGRGILSESNGRLDAANLAVGFAVQAEHVLPGELFRSKLAYETEPVDFYDDGVAVTSESSATAPASYVPVYGAACRAYIPFRSIVTWRWSFFLSTWHVRVNDVMMPQLRNLEAFVVANIGGATITHTRRRVPFSVLLENNAADAGDYGGPAGIFSRVEARSCMHYDQFHVEQVTTPGYREMSLRLFLEAADEGVYAGVIRHLVHGATTTVAGEWSYLIHTRATFGIRCCWVTIDHAPA